MGRESSPDVCAAGADAGNASVSCCCWSDDAAWAFELEDEEDDELLELDELADEDEEEEEEEEDEEDDDDEEESVDPAAAADDDEVAVFEAPPPPLPPPDELSELCSEQKDCGWYDLPNGTMDFRRFFTSGFKVKCVLNSFVSAGSSSRDLKRICRFGVEIGFAIVPASLSSGWVMADESALDCAGFMLRLQHYK